MRRRKRTTKNLLRRRRRSRRNKGIRRAAALDALPFPNSMAAKEHPTANNAVS